MERFVTRLTEHCDTSWRIYLRSFELADAGSRRMELNGDKRVGISESPKKRVVTIFRSLRKRTRCVTFMSVRIAKRSFRASAASEELLPALHVAGRKITANLIHDSVCGSSLRYKAIAPSTP